MITDKGVVTPWRGWAIILMVITMTIMTVQVATTVAATAWGVAIIVGMDNCNLLGKKTAWKEPICGSKHKKEWWLYSMHQHAWWFGYCCRIVHHTIHSLNCMGFFTKTTWVAKDWRGLVMLLIRTRVITDTIVGIMRWSVGGKCSIATTVTIGVWHSGITTRCLAFIIMSFGFLGRIRIKMILKNLWGLPECHYQYCYLNDQYNP